MLFFGSNPELKPPGGSLDMIFYFRYDSDPNIAMQASKIMCYIREASFIVVGCTSPAPGTRHKCSVSQHSGQSPEYWGAPDQWRWFHNSSQCQGSQSRGEGSNETLLSSIIFKIFSTPCKSSFDATSCCHWKSLWCSRDHQAEPKCLVVHLNQCWLA